MSTKLKYKIYMYASSTGRLHIGAEGKRVPSLIDNGDWIEIEHDIEIPESLFIKPKIMSNTIVKLKDENATTRHSIEAKSSTKLGSAELRG